MRMSMRIGAKKGIRDKTMDSELPGARMTKDIMFGRLLTQRLLTSYAIAWLTNHYISLMDIIATKVRLVIGGSVVPVRLQRRETNRLIL